MVPIQEIINKKIFGNFWRDCKIGPNILDKWNSCDNKWCGVVVFWCFCKMLPTEDELSTSAQVRPQFITILGKNMLIKLWNLLYPFLVSPPNICRKNKCESSFPVASVCFSIVCFGALPCFALDHNGGRHLPISL